MRRNNALKLLVCIALCTVTAALGTWLSVPPVEKWNIELQYPIYAPDTWALPLFCLLVFLLQGAGLYHLWKTRKMKDIWSVFLIFFIQIIFNVLWLFLLFSEKMPVAASIVGFISLPILFLLVYDVWVIEKKSAKYFSIALICITYRLFISVGVALNH